MEHDSPICPLRPAGTILREDVEPALRKEDDVLQPVRRNQ